jgi:hypothetical protein
MSLLAIPPEYDFDSTPMLQPNHQPEPVKLCRLLPTGVGDPDWTVRAFWLPEQPFEVRLPKANQINTFVCAACPTGDRLDTILFQIADQTKAC